MKRKLAETVATLPNILVHHFRTDMAAEPGFSASLLGRAGPAARLFPGLQDSKQGRQEAGSLTKVDKLLAAFRFVTRREPCTELGYKVGPRLR